MGMIGAIRFARRDTDEGKVKRMAFGQIEGIGLAAEGNGDFLDGFSVLPTGRLALLCANMSEINFFHDLTIIRLNLAIYFLLHRGNIKRLHGSKPQQGNLRFSEVARVLVRLDHVASRITNGG